MSFTGRAFEMVWESFRNFDANGDGQISRCELEGVLKALNGEVWTDTKLAALLSHIDTNKDGFISHREFLDWVFNLEADQQQFREAIGITMDGPSLLRELVPLEGNRDAEAELMRRLEVEGCAVIVKILFRVHDVHKLFILFGYLRALFALRVWESDVRLIKPDDAKFFVYAHDPAKAIRAALMMQQLMQGFVEWVSVIEPSVGEIDLPEVSIGVAQGTLVLIEGDYYGNPVNVASKLGEDLATAGELFVQAACWDSARECIDFADISKAVEVTTCRAEISGVELEYVKLCAKWCSTIKDLVTSMPTTAELLEVSHLTSGSHLEAKPWNAVVLVTDMSGFTKLTKKYGILHFLRLALKKRDILIPRVSQHGGSFVKNDGDNVIATFPDASSAVRCMFEVWGQIAAYNEEREKDFQIRTGCGLDQGEIIVNGKDIAGPAFENSFYLAEDLSEHGDILATSEVRDALMASPSLAAGISVSEELLAEQEGTATFAYHKLTQKMT